MKLYTRAAIEALEQKANARGVSMESLMEQAGLAVAEVVRQHMPFHQSEPVAILCGKGNNGGDGFVCAGYLARWGIKAVVILAQGKPQSPLAQGAFDALPQAVPVLLGEEPETAAFVKAAPVVVDAIFGFSFRGSLQGVPQMLLAAAAEGRGLKVAADLPSGVCCDTAQADSHTLKADYTVTFTGMKPGCVCYPGKAYCGEVLVASVGADDENPQDESVCFRLDEDTVKRALPPLETESNKGSHGRLLCVVGSAGMMGACIMAARGALRSGVGLLDIALPRELYPLVAPVLPEAVFTVLTPENEKVRIQEALSKATACLAGCGLGMERACRLVPLLLCSKEKPLLLDADALNALAQWPGWEKELKSPCVITPHPGEMARLTGLSIAEVQGNRLTAAGDFADRCNAVTVLKGAGTIVAQPHGRRGINPTGNPGMAKGGSGDVLAGIIGSFLAQGIEPFSAAGAGVYIHGLAGDICARQYTERAMLPTDLAETLPQVFQRF